ncbi:MAG TPA: GNAT family N-acetyltransferase [Pseudonocardiaceae bacterium]|nr:GNAT family N-acetyltransferase [Pseudonocardiaceae bacterium]
MEIELTLRPLTGADVDQYGPLLSRAFLHDAGPESQRELFRTEIDQNRAIGVFDGDRQVGGGIILKRSITLPGGDVVPFAGVSGISVASDYRRRGILTRIMRDQLHGLHESGAEPFAVLWASEARIYRRYGYGEASQYTDYDLPKGAEFRPGTVLSADPIREMPLAQARPLVEQIYAKALPHHPGLLSRDQLDWDTYLRDDPAERDGMTARRFAVHPEGYAAYRVKGGRDERGPSGVLAVGEVMATTPQAYASLWRYLLDMDLVRSIRGRFGSDEPLRQLLADSMTGLWQRHAALWVRIVDLDRALVARHYAAPVDVVFEVTDEFCPWNAGRWRLRADATGAAEVTSTEDEPDIATDILDLGAVFLGGTRLSTLARTGRVRELTDGAVAKASMAFLGEHEPETFEVF